MEQKQKQILCISAGAIIKRQSEHNYLLCDINIDHESILLKFNHSENNSIRKCLIDIGITGNPRIEYNTETFEML